MDRLDTIADLATIITAGVAAYGYGSYRVARHKRMIAVEEELARKIAPNDDSLSVSQLAAKLKLTDDQVIEAAYHSKKVEGSEGLRNERRLKFVRKS